MQAALMIENMFLIKFQYRYYNSELNLIIKFESKKLY